jgi:hypothetical protein
MDMLESPTSHEDDKGTPSSDSEEAA